MTSSRLSNTCHRRSPASRTGHSTRPPDRHERIVSAPVRQPKHDYAHRTASAERQFWAGRVTTGTVPRVASRFRGSVMGSSSQRGNGLGSIEVDETGVTLRTALRREIEVRREEITRVEVRRVRVPPFWYATNFYFVGVNGQRAGHYFVSFRASALRSAFDTLGYKTVDA